MKLVSGLLSLHQRIYEFSKRKALSYEEILHPNLKQYQEDQKYYSSRPFQTSSTDEFFQAIHNSQVIFWGDFHSFDQNSKNLEKVIKRLLKNKRKFILGLELVHHSHQKHVDAYLKKAITEEEFLSSISYYESWKFPWVHYKPLFDLARKKGITIKALNYSGSLQRRDYFSAKKIVSLLTKNPQVPLLVLFGELHLLPNKLPKKTFIEYFKAEGVYLKSLVVHQNIDEVYWKLRQNKRNTKILKFNAKEFILNSSPPWIKHESLVYWYENILEDPEFDLHESLLESGMKRLISDADDSFLFLAKNIVQTLGFSDLSLHQLEDFQLYDTSHLALLQKKIAQKTTSQLLSFYQQLIISSSLFKLPFQRDYYCPNYSVTRLAYLVGIHLYSFFEKELKPWHKPLVFFNHFFKQAFLAYLSSKVINPHRKCDLYLDLVEQAQAQVLKPEERELHRLTLKLIDHPSRLSQLPQELYQCYHLARSCGHFYAESFFEKVQQHKISFSQIPHLLSLSSQKKDLLIIFNTSILKNQSYQKKRKRFF